MKELNNDIQLIEKFLGGEMSEEEKKVFDDKMSRDKEFRGMLKDMDLLMEGVRQSAAKTSKEEKMERLRFYAEITGMEERAEEEDNNRSLDVKIIPMYRRPVFMAAAAAIALLIAVGLYWVTGRTPNNEKLFVAYFEPFDSPGSGLTRGNNEVTLKARAYDAYDNGRFDEAILLFDQILMTSDDAIIHLCLGNAQLKLGRLPEAEENFNHLLAEHSDLVTQAKWYLALAYLKQNKMERAKATLWEISKSSTYGEKALKLLKELD